MYLNHQCPNCDKLHERPNVPSNDGRFDNLCLDCINKGYKRYFVSWLDSYNTWNHDNDTIFDFEETDRNNTSFLISKKGLKNIKENYPIYEIEDWDGDGWVDCSHLTLICARNEQELIKRVEKMFEENGRNIDVFDVKAEDKSLHWTEEDFYERVG